MSRIGRKVIFWAFLLSTILFYSFSPGILFLGTSLDNSPRETDVVRKGRQIDLFEIREHNENLLQSLILEKGPRCAFDKRKIFNLGLPRTGTLSIVKVLGQYGFRSCHPFAEKSWTFEEVLSFIRDPNSVAAKAIRVRLSECDMFSDTPIYGMLEQLLHYYPDARFVMTTREKSTWEDSCERLMEYKCNKLGKNYIKFQKYYYGVRCWSQEHWGRAYDEHHLKVSNLLGNRVLYIPIEMPNNEKLRILLRYVKCKMINGTNYVHKQHALGAQRAVGGRGIEKYERV